MGDFFKIGLQKYREGDYEQAGELFQQDIENDETNPKCWNALGICMSKLGQYDNADTCFKNALMLEPGNSTYEKNLANNQKFLGNTPDPIANFASSNEIPNSSPPKANDHSNNTQEKIYEQIRKVGAADFLVRKEVKELPHILWEDEIIEKIIQGYYNGGTGILVATNKRLIFIDKGLLYGLKVEDFAYDKITSIQYKTGLILGEITIYASGNNAVIQNIQKGIVKPFAEYIRARITSVSKHASEPKATPPSQEDTISKLERLAALKNSGILSDREFEEQKSKILN